MGLLLGLDATNGDDVLDGVCDVVLVGHSGVLGGALGRDWGRADDVLRGRGVAGEGGDAVGGVGDGGGVGEGIRGGSVTVVLGKGHGWRIWLVRRRPGS